MSIGFETLKIRDHTRNLITQFENLEMMPLPTLPMDVVTDILVRLPAKSLMRFKSVCKSWYNMISGPDFVQLHLDRSLATRSNLHFVFATPILHLGDFDTFENPVELDYPFKKVDNGGASIIGSCNGLLCLWDYDYYKLIVAVYNPTTRTHKILPFLPRPSHCAHLPPNFIFGFGYDSVSHDYKFVRILQCSHKETNFSYSEVMIFSMKTDSWTRVLDDVPYQFDCRRGDGTFFNGALHWVIDTELYQSPLPIVGFDLGTNSFIEVPAPEFDLEWYLFMYVGVLDGCLCMMLNYLSDHEIWVMREYGVVKSWTRLYRVAKVREVDDIERTVAFSKSGKELLVSLCLYRITSIDMETLVIEEVKVVNNPNRRFDAHLCVENLLMLDDSSDVVESEQQQGKNMTRRRRQKRKRRRRRS